MKRLLYTLAILTGLSVSCYYDSEESVYPELGTCDTLDVTYSKSIVTLLDNNCLNCHAGSVASSKGGSINLEGYSNVVTNQDLIMASILYDGASKPMPKNSSKLKDCLIQQFQIWKTAGAQKN
jgi:hypothetical protein